MTGEEAKQKLIEGNRRYAQGRSEQPNLDPGRRRLLASEGQAPFATVLGCSDSRVPPEHIFDQGLGDLFVVRVAGHAAGYTVVGTLEYAVDVLGTPLLVVLGHQDCGAVKAALGGDPAEGALEELLGHVRPPAQQEPGADLVDVAQVDAAVQRNVQHTMDELMELSPVIRRAVQEGRVTLAGAVASIDPGDVTWLE